MDNLNQPISSDIQSGTRSGRLDNLFRRMWKYKLHYIIVWPGLLLVLLFKIFPFAMGIRIAFIDFVPSTGVFGSKWIGTDNFSKLFAAPEFRAVMTNTVVIKLEYMLAGGLAALVLALALSGIRSRLWRNTFATLFLVPYFIPAAVLAYVVMLLLSPTHSPLFQVQTLFMADDRWFRPILVLTEMVKTCGIPVLLAMAAIASKHASLSHGGTEPAVRASYMSMTVVPAIQAVCAFMIMQLSTLLSTDFELLYSMLNPLVYQVADMMDTFMFRMGLMNAGYSIAGAIWLIQFVVQLILTGLAYILIRKSFATVLFSRNFDRTNNGPKNSSVNPGGLIIAALYAIIVLLLLYVLFVQPWITPSSAAIGLGELLSASNFIPYFLIDLVAVIVFALITLTLAYPLTVKDLPGRGLYKAFLLVVIVMGSGTLHEYLLYRDLGQLNTFFPLLFSGFFSLISVFVLKSIFNSKHSQLKERASIEGRGELHAFFYVYIPNVWKPLIGLCVLHFVSLWNSFYLSLLYMNNADKYSPLMRLRTLMFGGDQGLPPGDPVIMQYAAVICLPPLLLLLIFRKFLTAETFISQMRKL